MDNWIQDDGLAYVHDLIDKSISLSAAEKETLKVYISIRTSKIPVFIKIFEEEQEKVKQLDDEFALAVRDKVGAYLDEQRQLHQEKVDAIGATYHKKITALREAEKQEGEDGDSFLDEGLRTL